MSPISMIKSLIRANQRGISTAELAGKYTESYFEDMKALNVMPADVNPRATEEIPKIIEVIQGLIEKGYAYKTPDGSVYFRVTKDAGLRQTFPPHSGHDAGRSAYRNRRAEGTSDGLRSLEGLQTRRAVLGQSLGQGPARLAYRMHRHVSEISGRNAGYSRRRAGPHLSAP